MMAIDWTISLSSLLTFVGFIAGGLSFALILRGDVKNLSTRMTDVETDMKGLTTVLQLVARQDERLNAQGARIDILQKRVFKYE